MEWQKDLNEYSYWLVQKRFSPRSIAAYVSRTRSFLTSRLQNGSCDPKQLSQAATEYWIDLRHTDIPAASLNAIAVALESYCMYHGMSLRLRREPVATNIRVLSCSDQQKYMQAVMNCEDAKARAICVVLYSTGISVCDCAALNVSDIDLGQLFMRVGNRQIKMDGQIAAAIKHWLRDRALLADPSEPALFVNKAGKRMSPPGLEYFVRRLAQRARTDVSPTALKQTFRAGLTTRVY